MRELIKQNIEFKQREVDYDEAYNLYKHDPYKTWFIDDLKARGEKKVSFYKSDWFDNLCAGPHVDSTKQINPDAFKLTHLAGAYWRGDEKNKMLTRIYGLAFETKKELEAYLLQREEAEKRDHRKLGKELKLFMISEEVGKGLPLWLPNGAFIRHQLEDYMYKKELAADYKYVYTPVLTHKNLYETSGHLSHYREDMYSPIEIEGEEYYLKPMNCPHHHMIYRNSPYSYKDLPLRLAEFGLCHRFERSGVLTGLIRARCFTQNDSHIYCAKSDLKKELLSVLKLFKEVYDDFKIKDYWYRLSLPDFSNKEKYGDIENREMWEEAGRLTEEALKEFGTKFVIGTGEASFYGPKIDVQIKNVNGKEDSIATAQVDFYSPNKFDLNYTNEKGEKEKPVIIHRAIMGSFDRFFAFLIEQTAGNFPLWLSPVQVKVIPVRTNHNEYAREVYEFLKSNDIRAEVDLEDENLGGKVRKAKNEKIPYWIVVGDKEVESKEFIIESRSGSKSKPLSSESLLALLQKEIKEKK
jgi:threonyl-tRNA synthetase